MRNCKLDYTSLCGIANRTIRHYAELQIGLYVTVRNCKMDYTASCGIHEIIIRHYAEITVRAEKINRARRLTATLFLQLK